MSIASHRFGTPLAGAQRNGHEDILAFFRGIEKKKEKRNMLVEAALDANMTV
jgi:hypothetical protein